MTYALGNKCAKNLCKQTLLVQLTIKNVVTCFLEHSVEPNIGRKSRFLPQLGGI